MIEWETWIYLMIYELLGVLFYLTYGLHHSKLNRLFRKLELNVSAPF